ncbi:hypothetical protein MKX03_035355, partial [Papaver bracteatum]
MEEHIQAADITVKDFLKAAHAGELNRLKQFSLDLDEFKVDKNIKDENFIGLLLEINSAVDYLLKMGANPEIRDDLNCSMLYHAAIKGHKEIIPLLLSKGINVDVTNELGSPLILAAAYGYHDTPNLICRETVTPLRASIYSQSCQWAEQLLK